MSKKFIWTGRQDPEDGDHAKRWHQIVTTSPQPDSFVSLIGFPCDLGVKQNKGRIGAKDGPDAIRAALANLAWHGKDGHIHDRQNIPVGLDLAQAQIKLGEEVERALKEDTKVVVLGGGHETAVGSFTGLLNHLNMGTIPSIGIINLDAHFDLRKPGENGITSGTPFYQIHDLLAQRGQKMNYLCIGISETSNTKALFERSHEWGVQYMLDTEMRPHLFHQVTDKIDRFLENCDHLYLTIDLDVLPHWQMPSVSAPAPYGVSLEIIEDIINHLATKQIKWLLSDLVEFNPKYDIDQHGAKTAARLCDKIIRAMTGPVPCLS